MFSHFQIFRDSFWEKPFDFYSGTCVFLLQKSPPKKSGVILCEFRAQHFTDHEGSVVDQPATRRVGCFYRESRRRPGFCSVRPFKTPPGKFPENGPAGPFWLAFPAAVEESASVKSIPVFLARGKNLLSNKKDGARNGCGGMCAFSF